MNSIHPFVIFCMNHEPITYSTAKLVNEFIQRLVTFIITRLNFYWTYLIPGRYKKINYEQYKLIGKIVAEFTK